MTRAKPGTMYGIGAVLLAGIISSCSPNAPAVPTSSDPAGHAHAFARNPNAENNAEVNRWLASLKSELAGYHRFEVAKTAGYATEVTPCMEQAGVGGMGFHYGDPTLIDGEVEALKPELLLYAPEKNGRMRLVAVEYIVPFTAWTSAAPPRLHGLEFSPNQTFQVWALHAWVWHNNPRGMFADWNPRVSC